MTYLATISSRPLGFLSYEWTLLPRNDVSHPAKSVSQYELKESKNSEVYSKVHFVDGKSMLWRKISVKNVPFYSYEVSRNFGGGRMGAPVGGYDR